jgi:hypothetical protein
VNWLVFSYSFPSNQGSSARVTLWRRLSRLGAVSPKSGVHVLPAREDCLESFQWLSKEVQQQKGECLLMNVDSFEGLSDQALIQLFKDRSEKEYIELEDSLKMLASEVRNNIADEERVRLHGELEKLRKKHGDVAHIDFFDAPGGGRLRSKLASLETKLVGREDNTPEIGKVKAKDFKNKVWVTRPKPHVDRLACAWLIRRFIDSKAKIRYSTKPQREEVSFDMKENSTFGHVGNLCTFETMMIAFDLNEPGIAAVAEIVHEIDLRDSRYLHPETAGVDSILKGWLLKEYSDSELETHGIALFDGLHADIVRKEAAGKGESKQQ